MTPSDATPRRGVLAIIPARGGSKGIPGKNMLRLGTQPLLAHSIDAVVASGVAETIVVSSDDPGVLEWAALRPDVVALARPPHLASDEATIASVAQHVAEELDATGVVAVFQPTSPFRRPESIVAALDHFDATGARSLASVTRNHHLHWFAENGDLDDAVPLFAERRNRQYAKWGLFQETGSIQLIDAASIRGRADMVADPHVLFELPVEESLDIDVPADIVLARRIASRGTIVFRLRANHDVGSGHLYHCLQLADELHGHHVEFLLVDCDPFVEMVLDANGRSWRHEADMEADLRNLPRPCVIVNDVLDTSVEEIALQRALGYRVVTIEDLGPGLQLADLVVNALYPPRDGASAHVLTGPRYATLRSEFTGLPPKVVRDHPERVLVTFGGTDPAQLGPRVAAALVDAIDVPIRVVAGPGAADASYPDRVEVLRSIDSMAAEMQHADVVVTSAGRTVYEAAATGTPVLVVAQNAREATHVHLDYSYGVVFAGIGELIDDATIVEQVQRLLASPQLRTELSTRLSGTVDLLGARRIAVRIEQLLENLW
jgi:CMP-N-acetylneuraminic acid synthetase/spore coat polysaccharide biosynthesis predicted glycosyltransferase SpsG